MAIRFVFTIVVVLYFAGQLYTLRTTLEKFSVSESIPSSKRLRGEKRILRNRYEKIQTKSSKSKKIQSESQTVVYDSIQSIIGRIRKNDARSLKSESAKMPSQVFTNGNLNPICSGSNSCFSTDYESMGKTLHKKHNHQYDDQYYRNTTMPLPPSGEFETKLLAEKLFDQPRFADHRKRKIRPEDQNLISYIVQLLKSGQRMPISNTEPLDVVNVKSDCNQTGNQPNVQNQPPAWVNRTKPELLEVEAKIQSEKSFHKPIINRYHLTVNGVQRDSKPIRIEVMQLPPTTLLMADHRHHHRQPSDDQSCSDISDLQGKWTGQSRRNVDYWPTGDHHQSPPLVIGQQPMEDKYPVFDDYYDPIDRWWRGYNRCQGRRKLRPC